MVTGISVIICCHNSAGKLLPTLKALSVQENTPGIAYEIILVDNNSTDDTVTIATNNWKQFGEPFPLTIVEEKKPGLSNARIRGIHASSYEYLVFCDDDNWLSKNYLSIVCSIFDGQPEVAMIGGTGCVELDKETPEWFKNTNGFGYAIGNEGRQTGYTDSVYGAGMAVRKKMLQALNDGHLSFLLSDRVGKKLSSGGDAEMCILVRASGKKIWFDERLQFVHQLPQSRINWPYYRRLRYAFGSSGVYLNLYDDDFIIPKKNVAFKNLIYYCLRYGHLILLSNFLKNEKYAYAMQQLGKLATLCFENDEIQKKIPIAVKNKHCLTALATL